MKVYADANCYQRGFDDQTQYRIRVEAAACEAFFWAVEQGEHDLVWSFMLQQEIADIPYGDRQAGAAALARLACHAVVPSEEICGRAQELCTQSNLRPKDALHLACAEKEGCDVLLTCDDRFVRRAGRVGTVPVVNPLDFVRREWSS